VRVIIDTHALLWALLDPQRLSRRERELIDHNEILVSAASIWEIGMTHEIGRLDCDPRQILETVEPAGFENLGISGLHTIVAASLPRLHGDPIDRMLIAQAKAESALMLTRDDALTAYGGFVTLG
jgi:PIN domain nuclease of toxin-antitoxin system